MKPSITRQEAVDIFSNIWKNKKPVPASIVNSLRRLIAGTEDLGKSRKEESGKIDRKSFVRFACGEGSVFSRNKRRESEACKVSILIDCSGSMSGENMSNAQHAIVQLGWLLDACKAPWAITGYNSDHFEFFLNKKDEVDEIIPHINFIKIKGFEQPTNSVAAEIGSLNEICTLTTPDFAAPVTHMIEFSKEKGDRKVVILITDGESLRDHEAKEISRIANDLKINIVVLVISHRQNVINMFNGEAIWVNDLGVITSKLFSHFLNRISLKHKVEI